MGKELYIKNMVCPRCITAVMGIFKELNIDVKSIHLGQVESTTVISNVLKTKLADDLFKSGFELIEGNNAKLIGGIKSLIIDLIHHSKEVLNVNYSDYLSDKLKNDYTYLSKLFSSLEGITIEQFILKQKIEKVKELLIYNELTLSQIAFEMAYSSSAHLSTQFKKETGMTPSVFKKQKGNKRTFLDGI
jgi:AraC-like DNA-binding protein